VNFVILLAVFLLAFVLVSAAWRRIWIVKAARNILRRSNNAFQANHIFCKVSAQDYPWLSSEFYEQAQRDAEAFGFTWLADIEDETLSQVYPHLRTFVRILLAPDFHSRFAIYEIVPGGPYGKPTRQPLQTRELISELSDGFCLITTTAPTAKILDAPPGVSRTHLPADSRMVDLLEAHRQAMDDYKILRPVASFEEIRDFDQATVAWQKGIDRQRAKLETENGLKLEEIVRIGGKGKEKLSADVHKQMQKTQGRRLD